MSDSSEITEKSRILVMGGTGVPSARELMARLAEIIPPGMEIAYGEPAQTNAAEPEELTEIQQWNREVERRKTERKERQAQRAFENAMAIEDERVERLYGE